MNKKTAFIIGTGPSLNKIDISKLKGKNTITFNRAYIAFEDWGFDPTYYCSIDGNDMRAMYKDINNLIENSLVEKFFLCNLTDNGIHPKESFQDEDKKDDLFIKNKNVFFLHNDNSNNNNFNMKLENNNIFLKIDSNVGAMSLPILYNLGYKKWLLLGVIHIIKMI